MTTSRADAIAFLNLAIDCDNPGGFAIELPTLNEAIAFRQAVHRARAEARKESTKYLDPDSPGYGASPWEHITCRIKPSPKTNPNDSPTQPYLLVASSSEAMVHSLKVVDPQTGEPIDLDLTLLALPET